MSPEEQRQLQWWRVKLDGLCGASRLDSYDMLAIVTYRSGIELLEKQLAAANEPPLDLAELDEALRQVVADHFLLFSRYKKFATRNGADAWVGRLIDSGVARKR